MVGGGVAVAGIIRPNFGEIRQPTRGAYAPLSVKKSWVKLQKFYERNDKKASDMWSGPVPRISLSP